MVDLSVRREHRGYSVISEVSSRLIRSARRRLNGVAAGMRTVPASRRADPLAPLRPGTARIIENRGSCCSGASRVTAFPIFGSLWFLATPRSSAARNHLHSPMAVPSLSSAGWARRLQASRRGLVAHARCLSPHCRILPVFQALVPAIPTNPLS
jgi:hypothetical protein